MNQRTYHLPSDVGGIASRFSRTSLKAIHLNTRSVKNKMESLEEFFCEFSFPFSVIMLSETWSTGTNDVFRMPDYDTYYLNRVDCRGGGVALLLPTNTEIEMFDTYSVISPDYEILTLRCSNVVFSVCYRPPKGNVAAFLNFYNEFVTFIATNNYTLIAGGDFNIDMGNRNHVTSELDSILFSNGFRNVINVPTRVTSASQSILDLFITNSLVSKFEAGVVSCSVSDHLPVFLCIDRIGEETNRREIIKYQHITDTALEAFRNAVAQVDWSDIMWLNNPNDAYNQFIDVFKQVYSSHFPTKTCKKMRKIRKPWITRELRQQMKTKDKMYRTFLKTRTSEDLKNFKKYRNKLTAKLRSARAEFYSNIFDVKKGRHDVVWAKLNALLRRNQLNTSPRNLKVNETVLSGMDLANAFNTFFTTMTSSGSNNDAYQYLQSQNIHSVFLEPVSAEEVISVVVNLSNSTSRDIDDIQIRPVKYVVDIIAPVLVHIFNSSLSAAVFPVKLQTAKVSVLYKKGDRNDLGNYRPVSILPIFSKPFEKILHSRLSKFITKHNLLIPNQFAFCKNKSTELALLEQKEYILTQFESKNIVIGVFIDYSKAFDLINHDLLLMKLECYGIRGHAALLIKSYLSSRQQVVSIGNAFSNVRPLVSGVPQGSILGPLLFNMYINDIISISSSAKFVIYADDTSIFFSGQNLNELIHTCNNTMKLLERWSQANYMRVNETKTKAVIFRPKNKQLPVHDVITLNSRPIEIVDSFKCLGVVFSASMTWENHVNNVIAKLAQITGVVGRVRYLLPKSTKLLLYNTLFYSHLNYCHLVWGTTTSSCLNRLFLLQKKFLRHVYNVPYISPSSALFLQARVIKIWNLYEYRLSAQFKVETSRNINYIRNLADLRQKNWLYPTRQREQWIVPTARTNSGKALVRHTLPSLLNKYVVESFNLSTCSFRELRSIYAKM